MVTAPQADYDSWLINEIESGQADNVTSLYCHDPPGTCTVYNASFIILFSFDLSLFHMQPGIIAEDEVIYNDGYVTFSA